MEKKDKKSICGLGILKVNSPCIRFSSAFVRFSALFLLYEKVYLFSSVFLYAHIRTLILDKSFPKNFFKGVRSILKYRFRIVPTQNFRTKLLSRCISLLSADVGLGKCERKSAYFFMEKLKRKKRTKNRYCVCKFTLTTNEVFKP